MRCCRAAAASMEQQLLIALLAAQGATREAEADSWKDGIPYLFPIVTCLIQTLPFEQLRAPLRAMVFNSSSNANFLLNPATP